jgi:hypothetical protein
MRTSGTSLSTRSSNFVASSGLSVPQPNIASSKHLALSVCALSLASDFALYLRFFHQPATLMQSATFYLAFVLLLLLALRGFLALVKDLVCFLSKLLKPNSRAVIPLQTSAVIPPQTSTEVHIVKTTQKIHSREHITEHKHAVYQCKTAKTVHRTLSCRGLGNADFENITQYPLCKLCGKF